MDDSHNNIASVSSLIKVNGQVLNLRLVGLNISREIGRIPVARLELIDGDPAAGNFETSGNRRLDPGEEVEILLGPQDQEEMVFKGIVTRQSISARGSGKFHLFVECQDKAFRMTLDRKVHFHHAVVDDPASGQRDPDTVKDVSDDAVIEFLVGQEVYGLELEHRAKLAAKESGNFRHENLLQYWSTDWDFLNMRLEATGRLCTVVDGKVIIFAPALADPVKATLEFGENLLEFEAEFDGTIGHDRFASSSWDIDQAAAQLEKENTSLPNSPGKMDLQSLAGKAGLEERTLVHGGDLKVNEAKVWAQTCSDRLALAKVRGTGKIRGTHNLQPGEVVALKGFGTHWDGNALISGIRHDYQRGKWNTYLQFGLSEKAHAEKYPVHASPASDLMPAVPGLLYGVVKGYSKSPGGYELIEVELNAPGNNDAPKMVYARHAALYASKKGGAIFRPEPEDEVVLGFIQQDPRFPVILGSFFSSQITADWALENGKQNQRGIYLTGENDEKWMIQVDEKNNALTVSTASQSITLDEKNKSILLKDANENAITMNDQGITLESSNGSITLKAGKTIESKVGTTATKIETNSVSIKGPRVQLNADTLAEIKAPKVDLN
ncbi:MAG TPA: hypothetical protein ENJ82_04795 [Bacteroidetes bacterium]|nr:hypothetical protein [Bacteroidota bacterium]